MDEYLLESHAAGADAFGDAPEVDLLAELMGCWDEVVPEAAAASAVETSEEAATACSIPVAVAVAEPGAASEQEMELELAAMMAAELAPDRAPVQAAETESLPEEPDFLAALLAGQTGEETTSEALANLAVTVDALTETTSPAFEAPKGSSLLDAADDNDVLDSLMGDLARSASGQEDGAPAAAEPEPADNLEKYVLFSLAGTRYAVAIHQVIETDRLPQVTRVPHVPEFVRGVVNLRGDILSLIDLRTLWGLPALDANKTARLLVVRSNGEHMVTGLVVDDVNGIAPIAPESLAVREGERNERIAPLLRGVYEHQQQSLHVIDLERLFLSSEIQQLAAN